MLKYSTRNCQSIGHFANKWGTVSYSASQSGQRGLYRAVKFAKMIIETSMSSQNYSGRSKVSLIHPDQILTELVPPKNVEAYNFVNFEFEIRVEGEGQDTSRLFRVVLGPCAQFYPCEASEQKWGQTPTS